MAYTLTFDASCKVKGAGGHAKMWSRHVARDVDERRGIKRGHANPRIDPTRTRHNVTMVRGEGGAWTACERSEQVTEAIDARLAKVTGRIQANSVVMRPLVLQMDPQWFAEHNPDWRENGLNEAGRRCHRDMVDFAEKWVRQHGDGANLVVRSDHLDEANPQVQLGFVPVTDDERLSQKDWFPSPASLRKLHTDFREHMISRGYDVERGRTERSTEHLSSFEFATMAERAKAEAAGTLAAARREAQEVVREATTQAEEIRESAQREAADKVGLAEVDADLIRATARQRARSEALAEVDVEEVQEDYRREIRLGVDRREVEEGYRQEILDEMDLPAIRTRARQEAEAEGRAEAKDYVAEARDLAVAAADDRQRAAFDREAARQERQETERLETQAREQIEPKLEQTSAELDRLLQLAKGTPERDEKGRSNFWTPRQAYLQGALVGVACAGVTLDEQRKKALQRQVADRADMRSTKERLVDPVARVEQARQRLETLRGRAATTRSLTRPAERDSGGLGR